jgi:hypothetical protein
MKMYGGSGCIYTHFIDRVIIAVEWSASHPGRYTPGTHWIRGWVVPRVGLDDIEKRKFLTLPGLEHSLYRLHYPGHRITVPWDVTVCSANVSDVTIASVFMVEE